MCEHLNIEGQTVIICGLRHAKPTPCAFCRRESTKQCDFPVAQGKTCDAYMCDACSVVIGSDLDHCLGHSRVGKRYRVVSGKHEGHSMLLLAWRAVPKWRGARDLTWRYASQCSCLAAGDLDASHLKLLDLTVEVVAA